MAHGKRDGGEVAAVPDRSVVLPQADAPARVSIRAGWAASQAAIAASWLSR
jgi:hypothetical protein